MRDHVTHVVHAVVVVLHRRFLAVVPDVACELFLGGRRFTLGLQLLITLDQRILEDVEARSAVLLFSQTLLHRLDAGADVLLRRRGALASLALEGGAIFGVVVGDDIARLRLPLAQAHPERSVVLDKPSRLVELGRAWWREGVWV